MNIKKFFLLAAGVIFTACELFKPAPPVETPNTEQTTEQIEEEETEEETEEEQEEPDYVERNDFITNMYFQEYFTGDYFNFSIMTQNATQENIRLDNISSRSLECKLMKGEEEIFSNVVDEDIIILLKEYGYIQVDYEDGEANIKVSNVEIDYGGKHYNVPYPLTFSKKIKVAPYTFTDAGSYHVEFVVDYEVLGEKYQATFKSGGFEVR